MMQEIPSNCPIPRWQLLKQQLKNVDASAFQQLIQSGKYTLLDVRTPQEYANFHLTNAVNIDYLGPNFLEEMEQLNPQERYLVYCRSGRRSVRACTLMKNAGFYHIIHLDGGLSAWELPEAKK